MKGVTPLTPNGDPIAVHQLETFCRSRVGNSMAGDCFWVSASSIGIWRSSAGNFCARCSLSKNARCCCKWRGFGRASPSVSRSATTPRRADHFPKECAAAGHLVARRLDHRRRRARICLAWVFGSLRTRAMAKTNLPRPYSRGFFFGRRRRRAMTMSWRGVSTLRFFPTPSTKNFSPRHRWGLFSCPPQ